MARIVEVGHGIVYAVFHVEVDVDEIEVAGDHNAVGRVGDVLAGGRDGVADAGAVRGDIHHAYLLHEGDFEVQSGGVRAHHLAEHGHDGVLLLGDIVERAEEDNGDEDHRHGDLDPVQQLFLPPGRGAALWTGCSGFIHAQSSFLCFSVCCML